MSFATSRSHGSNIARALGIPTLGLRSFVLTVPMNGMVTVDAVYLVRNGDEIVERLTHLKLTAEEEAPE